MEAHRRNWNVRIETEIYGNDRIFECATPIWFSKKKDRKHLNEQKKMHRKMINLLKSICADGTKRYEQTKQQK